MRHSSGGGGMRDGAAVALLAEQQRRELAAIREQAMELVASLDRIAKGEPDDKLLLKSGGVIDGLNTLTLIVTRIIDRERQKFGEPGPDERETTMNGRDIERRIIDEIDRLAAARATAGDGPRENQGD